MGSPRILIFGRGPVAFLAARLASVRGYEPTLALSSGPGGPALYLGGREGISSLVEAESATPIGLGHVSADPALPLLLYLGTPHRLVGCRLTPLAPSPEEEDRFFPGREILQTLRSPELDRRIELSYRKTSVRGSLGQRIIDWFLEPERQKESLQRPVRKEAARLMPPWQLFLEDMAPFAGLSPKKPEAAESLRLLANLTESRGVVLSGGGLSPEMPGVVIHPVGPDPLVLEKAGRGRGLTTPGLDTSFDRVLAFTGSPDPPLVSGSCGYLPEKLSPLWPDCILLRDSPGRVSLLLCERGEAETGGRARLVIPVRGQKDPEEEMRWWIDRWNRESLFPFLRPDSLEMAEAGPRLSSASGTLRPLREVTPFLSVGGPLSEMVDPTLLPVICEDFWADLSMAIPNLSARREP